MTGNRAAVIEQLVIEPTHEWPGYNIKKFQALIAYAEHFEYPLGKVIRFSSRFSFSSMRLKMDPVEGNLKKCSKHCTVRRIIQFEKKMSGPNISKSSKHRSLKINPEDMDFRFRPPLQSGFPSPLNPPSREILWNAIRRGGGGGGGVDFFWNNPKNIYIF